MKHASIIPLIGGLSIGAEQAFGRPPEYVLSYSPFAGNDKHLINYYEQRGLSVPYRHIDADGFKQPGGKVDAVGSVCPCAGLSLLNWQASADRESNRWMVNSAEYVLDTIRPAVYWGENAPGLMSAIGAPIRTQLLEVARKHGYSVSYYKTKSLLHGIPQVRMRSFFFMWRGDKVPVFDYYDSPYVKIEDLITSVKSNFQMEPMNPKTPSRDDPWYRYLLEVVHGGISHYEYSTKVLRAAPSRRSLDVTSQVERSGVTFPEIQKWFADNGFDKAAARAGRIQKKIDRGMGFMRRGTIIPKDYIGAFVSHYPHKLTHPTQDRYVTFREGMSIMGLPEDFELLDPQKSINHICQNVPVSTARDMALEIAAALDGKREWVRAEELYQYNTSRTYDTVEKRADLSEFMEA